MMTPQCRFCRTALPAPVLDLGSQPLSNAYLTAEDLKTGREQRFPLRLRVCDACFLVQVDDSVPPDAIFNADYAYFSSFSQSWLDHCRDFAGQAIARFDLGPTSQVLEVASNDGYLLQFFAQAAVPVLGIEPTANTADAARAKGIPTEVAFFNEATGRKLAERGFTADLIHGANVLAHVPDIADFVAGFSKVLNRRGTLTLEFPHLLRLIEATQFDTIYHEHFSYLSLRVVEAVLRQAGLCVYDLEQLPTHGGSLRLYCAHASAAFSEQPPVERLREDECAAGLDQPATYARFAAAVEATRDDFLAYLADAKRTGRRIAAYGAAAKGNTFLNYCGTTRDDIVAAYDRNPHKQGKLLPGSHIPIVSPDRIAGDRPDDLLILPWNLRDEIIGQFGFIRDWGGRFVTAVPTVTIVP